MACCSATAAARSRTWPVPARFSPTSCGSRIPPRRPDPASSGDHWQFLIGSGRTDHGEPDVIMGMANEKWLGAGWLRGLAGRRLWRPGCQTGDHAMTRRLPGGSGERERGSSMTGMGVPGVEDVAALARWLRARDVTAEGGMPEVRLIAGGRSNLTYRLDFPPAGSASAAGSGAGAATATGAATAAGSGAAAGVATAAGAASAAAAAPGSSPDAPRPLVLRRPPLGHVLPTAHDMGREFRVLSALHGTAVPVPRPLALCEDESVIGAPFYVMEWVDGVVLRTREDAEAITPAQATEISQRFITMLATIHGVDLGAVGLEKFGRPEGYLARQLARWQRQWELSVTREVPGYDELVQRHAAGLPASGATRATTPPRATNAAGLPAANGGPAGTLVHGDFRIDNMLLTLGTGPAIAAVVDWEMSTLGDPLADLGLTLVYWIDPGEEDLLD